MRKPLTKYVRAKLAKTRFKDREEIEHLIAFEDLIKGGGPRNMGQGWRYHDARTRYPADPLAITKELEPKTYRPLLRQLVAESWPDQREKLLSLAKKEGSAYYKQCLRDLKKQEASDKKAQQEERRQEKSERRKWLKHGGRA